ncbi:MAG TPA: hypothetical protein VF150_01195, partial [Thermoanaerobaculia bacterium]
MRRSSLLLTLMAALPCLLLMGAAAHAQPEELDGACIVALDVCSSSCNDLDDRAQTVGCLSRCDKAASVCLGDEEPTLSSVEYLAHWSDGLVFEAAGACHSTTPCPPEYGSCASWSTFQDCGDPFCGISTLCKECDEWGLCTAGGP